MLEDGGEVGRGEGYTALIACWAGAHDLAVGVFGVIWAEIADAAAAVGVLVGHVGLSV